MNSNADTTPSPSLVEKRWFFPVLSVGLLVAAVWAMTRAWDASLLDRFQFRQTQTALTSYWIQHDGFRLAYLMPVFGPPWSAPMEFPLYQWLVATLANSSGSSLLSSARFLGILFFLLSLPAVYGLGRWVEPDPRRRLLIPAALLAAPVCLFYSRAFMIESCAAALAVWFLHAYLRSLQEVSWGWTAATLLTGVLAALVKVTTFALFGIPAALYTLFLLKKAVTAKSQNQGMTWRQIVIAAAVPAIPILGAAIWWISFSDSVKSANPIADMLTSKNLSAWHYGTLAQRMDPAFWKFVSHQWLVGALSGWSTALLGVGLVIVAAPYRRVALWCIAGFFSGPLLFTNLFAIHEYYYFPSAYFATAAAGIILAGLVAHDRLPSGVKIGFLAFFFGFQAIDFNADYAATLKHPPASPPSMIDVVRRATTEEEVVLVYGWDWNTLIPYYAGRRAILMTPSRENNPTVLQEILGRLKPGQVSALVLQGNRKQDTAFIKWCTGLLNLSATAAARSPDGDVYVAANRLAALQAGVAEHPDHYPGIEFNFSNPIERPDPRLHYQKPKASDYAPVASPAPFAVYNPWTVEVAGIGGQPGISANAPSELHFNAPPGATSIEASVGIVEGAYTPPNATDGVDVVIFELVPGGGRRILFQRFLNPVATPADRGLQTITLTNFGPITGPLVFGLYPGPADNLSFDWSYWRKISIK
jgi:hypothetical protein